MLLRGLRESTEAPEAEVVLGGDEPLLPPLLAGLSQTWAKGTSPPEDGRRREPRASLSGSVTAAKLVR